MLRSADHPGRDRAFDFGCDLDLQAMHETLNAAGPWQWELREGAWYGDYLNARPGEGMRVRIHRYPTSGPAGRFDGLRDSGFSSILEIKPGNSVPATGIDTVFMSLLRRIGARGITEIEPYD